MPAVYLFCRNTARLIHTFATLASGLVSGLVFGVVFGVGLASSVMAAPAMVWSQQDGQAINVYFSADGAAVQALTHEGVNIAPNLFRGPGTTWLSWVDKSRRNANTLRYTQLSEAGKVLRSGVIPGVQGDLYAPAVAMDSQGRRVWLLWVEFNGNRENLFASYLDLGKRASGEWAVPMQITPDDEYSANLPVITRADYDSITVDWMRSSSASSETATAVIRASIWQAQRALQGAPIGIGAPARFEALSVRVPGNDEHLVKPLKPGQVLTADEVEWKNRVAGRKALMGAVHSGTGASSRLVEISP